MNVFFRHALRIVICLTLAFNGLVQAEMREPCMMDGYDSSQHEQMGCCDEQMDMANKLCKSGLECKASNVLVEVTRIKTQQFFALSPVVIAQNYFIPFSAPSSVWRPPRA